MALATLSFFTPSISREVFILITNYDSENYYIGAVFYTNRKEKVVVVGKSERRGFYFVDILGYGITLELRTSSLKNGSFKNPNKKEIYDVGFIGLGKYKCSYGDGMCKEYSLWKAMLERCYSDKFHKQRPTYKGCEVDERWHNYQNFCEDLPKIKNYKEWKESDKKREWCLDKDVIENNNRIYSLEKCMFVKAKANILKAKLTGKTYVGISPDGQEYEFMNQGQFARKHNLNQRHISSCVNGKRKKASGWTFKIK